MANYTVSATGMVPYASTKPVEIVLISGSVNGVFVFICVYRSALDGAFNAGGSLQIENYLSPLLLFASTALYQQQGAPINLTAHSTSAFTLPSYPVYVAPDQSTQIPSSWSQ